jgi:N-formylglutamate amidohydrolase
MPTARVEAGLGCLPRVAARGEAIYARRLTRSEGEARLSGIHDIYHQCLATELGSLKERHGRAFLIDCHSMPSVQPGRRNLADIVLGDRFGSSCDPRLTGRIERAFRANGFSVARNAPYAGGYTTRRYGRPKRDFHAVQIEINRGLYMDEQAVETSAGFAQMQQVLSAIVVEILDVATQIGRR